jgi:glycosyltransferase involved in cell wall biosynthesis
MEHLLIRSVETYCKQDFPAEEWELIIVSDNSKGDIRPIIDYLLGQKINFQYIRLTHDYGMRGNTVAFNTAFKNANGYILMETTAETMFTPDMVRIMFEPHLTEERAFVAVKTYNLTPELQLQIDTVDWRENVNNIHSLPGFENPWTFNNVKTTHFGTHQTCSIKKSVFYDIMGEQGFPLFGDYGSEDPFYASRRPKRGVKDITIMEPMAIHQWHPPFQYWMAKGYAPHFNRNAHSLSNFLNDTTKKDNGEPNVPAGGTRFIWDGGSDALLTDAEIAEYATWDERVRQTGCKIV